MSGITPYGTAKTVVLNGFIPSPAMLLWLKFIRLGIMKIASLVVAATQK
jgi:hypothetical protein